MYWIKSRMMLAFCSCVIKKSIDRLSSDYHSFIREKFDMATQQATYWETCQKKAFDPPKEIKEAEENAVQSIVEDWCYFPASIQLSFFPLIKQLITIRALSAHATVCEQIPDRVSDHIYEM
jgi:hypothetical protein